MCPAVGSGARERLEARVGARHILDARCWSRHDLHRLMAVPAANSIYREGLSVDREHLPRTDGFGSRD
jgi:hypothetical protein